MAETSSSKWATFLDMYGQQGSAEAYPSLGNTQALMYTPTFGEMYGQQRATNGHTSPRNTQMNTSSRGSKTQAEFDLSKAQKTVMDLTLQLEQFTSAQAKKSNNVKSYPGEEDSKYKEVMRELELVKQELSKLKIEMDFVLDRKALAERSIEVLRDEIVDANEEHVLVELAKIEAVKELESINAQKESERSHHSFTMEKTRTKIADVLRCIDHSKELKNKLEAMETDVQVLQNELGQVKDTWPNSSMHDHRLIEGASREDIEKIEAAKKELQVVRDEGFQFMASMDIIRQELQHVSAETARLKSIEEKANPTVQILNSKIKRATSKLSALSIAEENANNIVLNLSSTHQQLTTELEAAKKQRHLINDETTNIKAETAKIESEIDILEENLKVALKEVEDTKVTETFALQELKTLRKEAIQNRASLSQHSSSITISKFEYNYLIGRAEGVEEIASLKVAAAQAWIEALKASEKETLMKIDIAHRELCELNVENVDEEGKVNGNNNMQLAMASTLPRKSTRRLRRPSSPATRHGSRAGSITIKRRTKIMPNLGNVLGNKGIEEYQQET